MLWPIWLQGGFLCNVFVASVCLGMVSTFSLIHACLCCVRALFVLFEVHAMVCHG